MQIGPPQADFFSQLRWLPVISVASTDAPGGALLRVTGISDGVYTVDIPNADNQSNLLVNGPAPLPAGGEGMATFDAPFPTAYDTADGTPAIGEAWGAKSGEWKLRKTYTGFTVYSASNGNGLVDVVRLDGIITGNTTSAATGTSVDATTNKLLAYTPSGITIQSFGPDDSPDRLVIGLAASPTQWGMITPLNQNLAGQKILTGSSDWWRTTRTSGSLVAAGTFGNDPEFNFASAVRLDYSDTALATRYDAKSGQSSGGSTISASSSVTAYTAGSVISQVNMTATKSGTASTATIVLTASPTGPGSGGGTTTLGQSAGNDYATLTTTNGLLLYGGSYGFYDGSIKWGESGGGSPLSGTDLTLPTWTGGIITGKTTVSLPGGGSGTVTSIDVAAPAAGITSTGGPITTSGTITLALADDLAALEALSGTDTIYYRSGASAWSAVTVGAGLTFTSGTLANSGVTSITLTQPAAGITITNSGVALTTSGTRTFALANDLAALEALSGTNTIYYRSGADTWSEVTIGTGLSFTGGTLANTAGVPSYTSTNLSGNLDVTTTGFVDVISLSLTAGTFEISYSASFAFGFTAGTFCTAIFRLYDGTSEIAQSRTLGGIRDDTGYTGGTVSRTLTKLDLGSSTTIKLQVQFDGGTPTWALRRVYGDTTTANTTIIAKQVA